jgi:hypothetical protein
MSARSWCEARTQGAFVSLRDTDALEDNVLGPRDRAQPVFLCFQPGSESSVAFVAEATGATEDNTARRRARPGG